MGMWRFWRWEGGGRGRGTLAGMSWCAPAEAARLSRGLALLLGVRVLEVFVEHHEGDEFFTLFVLELLDMAVCVFDDLARLFGVCDVEVHFLFQVGEVGPDLDVVLAGAERPFHEPCLEGWLGHDGDGV